MKVVDGHLFVSERFLLCAREVDKVKNSGIFAVNKRVAPFDGLSRLEAGGKIPKGPRARPNATHSRDRREEIGPEGRPDEDDSPTGPFSISPLFFPRVVLPTVIL